MEEPHEDCFDNSALFAWPVIHGLWFERILEFHSPASPPNPLATQLFVAISASHFSAFFFAVQVIGGLLLLSASSCLALVLLAAEIFNILAFHLAMAPATIGPGLVVAVLWVLVFLQYRGSSDGILSARRMGRNESEGAGENSPRIH
jgi:putative oxidoreductase